MAVHASGAHAFDAQLTPAQRRHLHEAARAAWQAPPADLLRWWISHPTNAHPAVAAGYLTRERAAQLAPLLAGSRWHTGAEAPGLHWPALHLDATQRSTQLQAALEQCHAQGWVHGWRDEAFAFWQHDCATPPTGHPPALFAVERSGFRFLGLRSHAVHINGFTPDGRLWCGRRALNKPTEPGKLDNVTAGGLPAGETLRDCALRELFEEAGARLPDATPLHDAGHVPTARMSTGGWHDESLQVYNWTCPADWTPRNQDGEVAEFLCLSASEVMHHVAQGAFTDDAVASLAQGLGLAGATP